MGRKLLRCANTHVTSQQEGAGVEQAQIKAPPRPIPSQPLRRTNTFRNQGPPQVPGNTGPFWPHWPFLPFLKHTRLFTTPSFGFFCFQTTYYWLHCTIHGAFKCHLLVQTSPDHLLYFPPRSPHGSTPHFRRSSLLRSDVIFKKPFLITLFKNYTPAHPALILPPCFPSLSDILDLSLPVYCLTPPAGMSAPRVQ